ncbi:MAG: cobalamin B12-binding domain-containing protein [Candidatus Bathyarchaeia archaeon]
MDRNVILNSIKDSLINLDFEKSLEYTKLALENGVSPQEITLKSVAEGMKIIGKKFESSEYFLSELIVAGEIGREITKLLEPYLKSAGVKKIGKIVIGTVIGDLHDIGKNIVSMMLEAEGFGVVDLGVDVPTEKFVEAVRRESPEIVGMSTLLTVTMVEMKNVIDALKKANLRDKVKIIIGGAAVTEEYARGIGADGYGANAVEGVRICKTWISGKA